MHLTQLIAQRRQQPLKALFLSFSYIPYLIYKLTLTDNYHMSLPGQSKIRRICLKKVYFIGFYSDIYVTRSLLL